VRPAFAELFQSRSKAQAWGVAVQKDSPALSKEPGAQEMRFQR
jgi:hypothetical protein